MHFDGARMMNACVKLGMSPAQLTAGVQCRCACQRARRTGRHRSGGFKVTHPARTVREKLLGGSMRQVGVLAAAALYALDHHVERLADDHANAIRLGEQLRSLDKLDVDMDVVDSNMVFVNIPEGRQRRCRPICTRAHSVTRLSHKCALLPILIVVLMRWICLWMKSAAHLNDPGCGGWWILSEMPVAVSKIDIAGVYDVYCAFHRATGRKSRSESARKAGMASASGYNRMYMPTGYGDPAAEYDGLVNHVAIWDVGVERQVALKGPDALALARYLTPRNLDSITLGRANMRRSAIMKVH